ncbi:hypothetical protein FIBSPDRAFT_68532 [Athelia psychrophila]|uniref:Uncharacterized protein n=1 Tax=Athelia psychrophila TaxID=1759441 RepID=A0A166ERD2_9AGAM|nr:hypothetical protein FIBSPDRAFT_68532 [Fibularhizoctonia sp. CBS 109695]
MRGTRCSLRRGACRDLQCILAFIRFRGLDCDCECKGTRRRSIAGSAESKADVDGQVARALGHCRVRYVIVYPSVEVTVSGGCEWKPGDECDSLQYLLSRKEPGANSANA